MLMAGMGASSGSPPLTRGKVAMICCNPKLDGITPAYAGKRPSSPLRAMSSRDHPRLRGEKFLRRFFDVLLLGSPPLTRGKGQLTRKMGRTLRDHPRLRGEKVRGEAGVLKSPGSPPLTRGKGRYTGRPDPADRITPAYAGKSCKTVYPDPRRGDHPRLRGEKFSPSVCRSLFAGSPPLTRGKGAAVKSLPPKKRITPAYAGKSQSDFPILTD